MAEAKPEIEVYYFLFDREKRTVLGQISCVKLSPNATVALMKKLIKEAEMIALPDSVLAIWRCNDPDVDLKGASPDERAGLAEKALSKGSVDRLDPLSEVGVLVREVVLVEVPGA